MPPISVTSEGSCAPEQSVTVPVPWVQGCSLLRDRMGRSQEGPGRSARACFSLSSPSLLCDRSVCAPCFTPFHSHRSPWLNKSVSRHMGHSWGFLFLTTVNKAALNILGQIILWTNCWVGG